MRRNSDADRAADGQPEDEQAELERARRRVPHDRMRRHADSDRDEGETQR